MSRLHSGLIKQVHCSIHTLPKDKRRKIDKEEDDWTQRTPKYFALRSPLLEVTGSGKDVEVSNLNPFWTVLRHPSKAGQPNMELVWDSIPIDDIHFPDRERSGSQAVVRVPRLRNTMDIKPGDVLSLANLYDDDL